MSDDDPVKIIGNPTALSLCVQNDHFYENENKQLSMKQAYLQTLTPTGFQILIVKSKERKIQTKPSQNLTKAGQGSKPTYFHSRG